MTGIGSLRTQWRRQNGSSARLEAAPEDVQLSCRPGEKAGGGARTIVAEIGVLRRTIGRRSGVEEVGGGAWEREGVACCEFAGVRVFDGGGLTIFGKSRQNGDAVFLVLPNLPPNQHLVACDWLELGYGPRSCWEGRKGCWRTHSRVCTCHRRTGKARKKVQSHFKHSPI